MRFLLYLKPWALFTLLVAIPITLQIISNLALFTQPIQFHLFLLGFITSMVFMMGGLFSWLWTLGIQLQKLLPDGIVLPTGRLKAALLLPAVYILTILAGLVSVSNGAFFEPASASILPLFAVVFPLHLLSMAAIFYSLYLVAKALKCVELQQAARFSEFLGEFFMLWFFPVGIWMIQPRINRLFASAASIR